MDCARARVMDVLVVSARTLGHAKFLSDHHRQRANCLFIDSIPSWPPNQQCQSSNPQR